MRILITGGAGFIGTNVTLSAIQKGHSVLNVDCLSYAGSLNNNLMEGDGEINLNDRFVYKGQFKRGTFDGTGTLVQYDEWGDVISLKKGEFKNGKFFSGEVKEMITDLSNPLSLQW